MLTAIVAFFSTSVGKSVMKYGAIAIVVGGIVLTMWLQQLSLQQDIVKLDQEIAKQSIAMADLNVLVIKLRASNTNLQSIVDSVRSENRILILNNKELQLTIKDNERLCEQTIANITRINKVDCGAVNITPEPGQVIDNTSSLEYIDIINEGFTQ